jgi:hypothetical protein
LPDIFKKIFFSTSDQNGRAPPSRIDRNLILIRSPLGGRHIRYRALILATLLSGLMGSGCATRSEDMAATYVSPPNYKQLNCRQLADAAALISERAFNLRGERDDSKHTWEIVPPSGAPVVLWPTAFMTNDPVRMAEYTTLKGEFESILQMSVRKGCSTRFEAASDSNKFNAIPN